VITTPLSIANEVLILRNFIRSMFEAPKKFFIMENAFKIRTQFSGIASLVCTLDYSRYHSLPSSSPIGLL